tara:strand:+ start:23652 stop:23975 length:324 start_codon:yes stop_codon:yes gene_type:complete
VGHPTAITDDQFESEVINSGTPVLVDFWAEWCGPCKAVAPTLEELAEDYDGRLKIVKVDIDENREAATRFGIRSIPSLLLFKDGAEVDRILGALPKQQLAEKIDNHL